MDNKKFIDQISNAWNAHNSVNLLLIRALPKAGFDARPAGSRGRTVGEQLVHMNRVRLAWLHYHRTGERANSAIGAMRSPDRAALRKAFVKSGKDVAGFISHSLKNGDAPRAFGKNAFRWMGYLISHESHHRGQIMTALLQNGARLPDKIVLNGFWGPWIWGK